jgi:hypothetical protein
MRKTLRILPVLAVAAFLAGCEGPCQKIDTISGPTLTSGSADFSNVAAVGTSISAGYQSAGLVDRHQIHSFPALFAAQVGMTVMHDGKGSFTFNGISHDGIAPLLKIQSIDPLVINNAGQTGGAPENQEQQTDYHNLAIPGQLAVDFVDSTYYTVDPNPVRGAGYNKTYFNLVYRSRGLGVQQLARRAPTFVTYELGLNEVLSATLNGNANIFPTATFIAAQQAGLNSIHAALPNTKVAIFNIPDVEAIPYCTTFPPVTLSTLTGTPVALLGPGNAPLAPGDRVLLPAAAVLATGQGFPLDGYNYVNPAAPGTGVGLPGNLVLDESEQASIATSVIGMNDALASYVAANPDWTVLVDMNALLRQIDAEGYTIGSTHYTGDFVTGGLFSLDGVHPNDLAHAILCNLLIDAVNGKWGSTIPHLNLSEYATATSSRARTASGEKLMPAVLSGLDAGLSPLGLRR